MENRSMVIENGSLDNDLSVLGMACSAMIDQLYTQTARSTEGDFRLELADILEKRDIEKLKALHQRLLSITNPAIGEPESGYR